MKKLFNLFVMLFVCLFLMASILQAAPLKNMTSYAVTVTTLTIDGYAYHVANFTPLLSASKDWSIYGILLSKDSTAADETITIYDNCTGTATVTVRCTVVIASGTVNPVFIPFSDANPLTVTKGLILRKTNGGCVVRATIFVK
jgi:hypothetical protein